MMSTMMAACAAALLMGWVSLAGVFAQGQDQGPDRGRRESLESENRHLREKVRDLEDAGGMLVENLSACAEENHELAQKLAALDSPGQASPRQLELIDGIREALLAPSDLNFLAKLDEVQLQRLLGLIRGRVNGSR